MGIPGYGSPFITNQPFGRIMPQGGVPAFAPVNTNNGSFLPGQSQNDLFSPSGSALDFSRPGTFNAGNTGFPTNTGNPFMSFVPQSNPNLRSSQGFDELVALGAPPGAATTGTTTATNTADGGTTTGDGTTDDGTVALGTPVDGAITPKTKKRPKMTLLETIQLELYGTTPKHPDWMAFYGKVCDNDEKPVQVHPQEDINMISYGDEG